jgi:hypothetical protein
MLLDCERLGVEFMFDVRATLTPFATMPPAALTIFIAVAFCIADPAKVTE